MSSKRGAAPEDVGDGRADLGEREPAVAVLVQHAERLLRLLRRQEGLQVVPLYVVPACGNTGVGAAQFW